MVPLIYTIGTNGNANGTIGSPISTIGKIGKPIVPSLNYHLENPEQSHRFTNGPISM